MAIATRMGFALFATLLVISAVSALGISTTVGDKVRINISANGTQDSIQYTIIPSLATGSCLNCSALTDEINLTPGTYNITALATSGNQTDGANATFTIPAPNTTNATNVTANVTNTTNITNNISANVTTNLTNATINVTNQTNSTTNITPNTTVNITPNVTQNTTNTTKNDSAPRFTQGLNKLPQAVANNELTDAQLAAIIRNSSINPGVLNRLVKTGKLGNESINAIIETQKTPPSIFQKIGRFLGMDVMTAKERIAEQYNLTAQQEEKLAQDPDVSEKVSKQLKESAKNKTAPGQAKRVMQTEPVPPNQTRQPNEAPGQLKKQNATDDLKGEKGAPEKPAKDDVKGKPEKTDADKPGNAKGKP